MKKLLLVLFCLFATNLSAQTTDTETIYPRQSRNGRAAPAGTRNFSRGNVIEARYLIDADITTMTDPQTDVTITIETFRGGTWQHKYSLRYIGHAWIDKTTGTQGVRVGMTLNSHHLPFVDGKDVRFIIETARATNVGAILEVVRP